MRNSVFIQDLQAERKIIDETAYRKIFKFMEASSENDFDRGLLIQLDDIYQTQARLALELNSVAAAKNLYKHLEAVTDHQFFRNHFPYPAFSTYLNRWRAYVELIEPLTWKLLPRYWQQIRERQEGLEKYVVEFGKNLLELIKDESLKNWLKKNRVVEKLIKDQTCDLIVNQLSEDGQLFFLRQDDLKKFWKDQVCVKTLSMGDNLKIVFTF